jgi:signal transduction histidine kinase
MKASRLRLSSNRDINASLIELDAGRENRWLAILYPITVVSLTGLLWLFDDVSQQRKIVATVLASLSVLVFSAFTQRHIGMDETKAFPGGIVAIVLGAAMFAVHPMFLFMLFALYPLCFLAFPRNWETKVAIVLGLASAVAIARWNEWSLGAWLVAFVQGGIGTLFAMTMGRWINRILDQSRERRSLLDALEATRIELAEVHRSAGVSAERDRMGTEIHDTLAQGFTSLLMLVRGASASIEANPSAARELLRVAERTAQENLDEARSLVANTRPAPLQNAAITAALQRLVDRFSEETGISANIEVLGTPHNLDPAHDVVLLRTAQETLANVRKHAGASSVLLTLNYSLDGVTLDVVDNGRGFDRESVDRDEKSSGFGLAGMKNRAAQVGGEVKVTSKSGEGTHVQVSL